MRTARLLPSRGAARAVLLVLAAAALAAGCGDSPTASGGTHQPPPPPPPAVAAVQVTPGAQTLAIGGWVRLQAVALAADGAALEGHAFEWSSSNPAVATVNADGTVSAHATGSVLVTARSGGKQGQARVDVPAPPVQPAEVVLSLDTLTLRPGESRRLTARVLGPDGSEMPGYPVTWAVEGGTSVTVDADGMVRVVGYGTAFVVAHSGEVAGWTLVTVRAPGDVTTFDHELESIDGVSLGERFPRVATTQWLGPDGVLHPAEVVVVGGVLRISLENAANPSYQQDLLLATYLLDQPAGTEREPVAERIRTDRGSVEYHWETGSYTFRSTTYAGLVIPSATTAAGMTTTQRVGQSPADWSFGWVRKQ